MHGRCSTSLVTLDSSCWAGKEAFASEWSAGRCIRTELDTQQSEDPFGVSCVLPITVASVSCAGAARIWQEAQGQCRYRVSPLCTVPPPWEVSATRRDIRNVLVYALHAASAAAQARSCTSDLNCF